MQILIDQSDLKRMSPSTRGELLRILQGDAGAPPPPPGPGAKGFRWRTPYDLTPELTRKLMCAASARRRSGWSCSPTGRPRDDARTLGGVPGRGSARLTAFEAM
jgi:hypothetical protein